MAETPKRQPSSIPSRVCLLSEAGIDGKDAFEYKLYVLDLNSDSGGCETYDIPPNYRVPDFTCILPNLRFDSTTRPLEFCLLGSTLYIFEGYRYSNISYPGKSAFKLELYPPTFGVNHKIEDSELEEHKLCDMPTSKVCPRAIPTPDGKRILVFSTEFLSHVRGEEAIDFQFELYDPSNKLWEKLPGLSSFRYIVEIEDGGIEAYSFINDHVFFIQLAEAMFVLDLESIGKGWRCLGPASYSDPMVPWKHGHFPTINELVFTSSRIYDAREFGLSCQEERDSKPSVIVPESPFPPTNLQPETYFLEDTYPSVTLVHHDIQSRVVRWCALKAQILIHFNDETGYTRVSIDRYVTKLSMLNTAVDTNLQLIIDHYTNLLNLKFVPTI